MAVLRLRMLSLLPLISFGAAGLDMTREYDLSKMRLEHVSLFVSRHTSCSTGVLATSLVDALTCGASPGLVRSCPKSVEGPRGLEMNDRGSELEVAIRSVVTGVPRKRDSSCGFWVAVTLEGVLLSCSLSIVPCKTPCLRFFRGLETRRFGGSGNVHDLFSRRHLAHFGHCRSHFSCTWLHISKVSSPIAVHEVTFCSRHDKHAVRENPDDAWTLLLKDSRLLPVAIKLRSCEHNGSDDAFVWPQQLCRFTQWLIRSAPSERRLTPSSHRAASGTTGTTLNQTCRTSSTIT